MSHFPIHGGPGTGLRSFMALPPPPGGVPFHGGDLHNNGPGGAGGPPTTPGYGKPLEPYGLEMTNKQLASQAERAGSLERQLSHEMRRPVTPAGSPTPFPSGQAGPLAGQIPTGIPIQAGDLADKALRATLQARDANGQRFIQTPQLGSVNVERGANAQLVVPNTGVPGGTLPPVADPGTFGQYTEAKLRSLRTFLLLQYPAEVFQQGTPQGPGSFGDNLGYSAGLIGTSFAGATLKGGPVTGVFTAFFQAVKFQKRAIDSEKASLTVKDGPDEVVARNPNPTGDPAISQRLAVQNALVFGGPLPQVTGPARDC